MLLLPEPVDPVTKVCIDRLALSILTSFGQALPILKTFPRLIPDVNDACSYLITSFPKSACSITGRPHTDFLGSPICIANSLPLTMALGVTSMLPNAPEYLNTGCIKFLTYCSISPVFSFSKFPHELIAAISTPEFSPRIIALYVAAAISAAY